MHIHLPQHVSRSCPQSIRLSVFQLLTMSCLNSYISLLTDFKHRSELPQTAVTVLKSDLWTFWKRFNIPAGMRLCPSCVRIHKPCRHLGGFFVFFGKMCFQFVPGQRNRDLQSIKRGMLLPSWQKLRIKGEWKDPEERMLLKNIIHGLFQRFNNTIPVLQCKNQILRK